MSLLKEKFDWVKGELDSWKLTREEKSWLLGGDGIECGLNLIEPDSKAGKLLEARFDAIKDIKETLVAVYGGDDLEQETLWLRGQKDIDPFNGMSPLEFIKKGNEEGNQDVVVQLARAMDGP